MSIDFVYNVLFIELPLYLHYDKCFRQCYFDEIHYSQKAHTEAAYIFEYGGCFSYSHGLTPIGLSGDTKVIIEGFVVSSW